MKQAVEEYMADLLSAGIGRDTVAEKGYEYALALQTDQQLVGAYVPASYMAIAASTVRDAIHGAYRIYELRQRIR